MYFFYISDLCRWQRLHWTVALFSEHVTPLLTDSMFISLVFWRCFLLVRYPIIMHHKMEKKKKEAENLGKTGKKEKEIKKKEGIWKKQKKELKRMRGCFVSEKELGWRGQDCNFICLQWLVEEASLLSYLPSLAFWSEHCTY